MTKVDPATRSLVVHRASGLCEYCLSPEAYSCCTFSVDHVRPRSTGGEDNANNLALCCQQCNNHKFNAVTHADPVSLKEVPLYNPRADKWSDHFAWDFTMTQIVGISAIGRATVDRLQLNRDGVVNLRNVLREVGFRFEPPASGADGSQAQT